MPEGNDARQFAVDALPKSDPQWSPGGQAVAYVVCTEQEGEFCRGALYLADANGENTRKLRDDVIQPRWSPDGDWLAFLYTARQDFEAATPTNPVLTAQGIGELRILAPDTMEETTVVSLESGVVLSYDWSPDGTQFALALYRDGKTDLFTAKADGTGLTQITTDGLAKYAVAWGPPGAPKELAGEPLDLALPEYGGETGTPEPDAITFEATQSPEPTSTQDSTPGREANPTVGTPPVPNVALVDNTTGFFSVSIGDLNSVPGDEIVGGGADNNVHVYQWDGSSWLETDMDDLGKAITHVEIGDADNDGQNEFVVATRYDPAELHMYDWDGAAWTRTLVTSLDEPGSEEITEFRIEDATGDGTNEVVVALAGVLQTRGGLYVYQWAGNAWTELYRDAGFRVVAVAVGEAANSGQTGMVAATDLEQGALYQYKWNGAGFDRTVMDSGRTAFAVAIGDADNDGKNEVVVGSTGELLHAYKWDAVTGWNAFMVSLEKSSNRAIHVVPGGGIVTTSRYDGCHLYEWDGTAWKRMTIQEDVLYAEDSALGDAGDDGTLDLIVAGAFVEYNGGLWAYALPLGDRQTSAPR